MNRDGIEYVKDLLDNEKDPAVRDIAKRVWTLSIKNRDEVLIYLTRIMTANPPPSRAFEVAREIWWLMGERGAAA